MATSAKLLQHKYLHALIGWRDQAQFSNHHKPQCRTKLIKSIGNKHIGKNNVHTDQDISPRNH